MTKAKKATRKAPNKTTKKPEDLWCFSSSVHYNEGTLSWDRGADFFDTEAEALKAAHDYWTETGYEDIYLCRVTAVGRIKIPQTAPTVEEF